MFRKETKMSEDWSYQKVLKNAEIQKQLIMIAYAMLKPGGKMVYSTCSFSYEEDEEIIDFLLNNTDAELDHIPDSLYYFHNKNNDKGIHILPSLFPGEGHYIALISKPGVIVSKIKDSYYEKKEKFGDYLFT